MTWPTSIGAFLDEFERVLKVSGRRRRRVLDEARDHLIDAAESGISAGMDPLAAEIAAIEAFGDATTVASRFDRGFLALLADRGSEALRTFDGWHGIHPLAANTLLIAPFALLMAVMWSPLPALGFLGPWAASVWIGIQLKERKEPGFRHRIWAWKREHPGQYQWAASLGGVFGWVWVIAMESLARLPHVSPWLFLVLVLLLPPMWAINSPRPYRPPPASAA
jgi:HAAS domain-containing protein